MLVIPARDIIIRAFKQINLASSFATPTESQVEVGTVYSDAQSELQEPLLVEEANGDTTASNEQDAPVSLVWRLAAAIFVFWTGGAVACCVTSIDVVWDLLGSSLSILLSYLVPCGSYIALTRKHLCSGESAVDPGWRTSAVIYICWFLVLVGTPLMFILTGNAVNNTFFHGEF
jgi:amino acid permease